MIAIKPRAIQKLSYRESLAAISRLQVLRSPFLGKLPIADHHEFGRRLLTSRLIKRVHSVVESLALVAREHFLL
jgi:hypothetical protein